jgi:hypothetical protein
MRALVGGEIRYAGLGPILKLLGKESIDVETPGSISIEEVEFIFHALEAPESRSGHNPRTTAQSDGSGEISTAIKKGMGEFITKFKT